MANYFFDSSALLKAYRNEIGSQQVVELMQAQHRLFISRLAHVEVASAIARRGRASGTSPALLKNSIAELDREVQMDVSVIESNRAIMRTARRLAELHALRGADAVQLSCALGARRLLARTEPLTVLSSDHELNAAAAIEGLTVIDPTHP
jgi:uncharacterized protein